VRLTDTRGREYYDGTSSIWLNVHGHRVPEIDDAIRAQLDRVAHSTLLGLANVPSAILAKRLVDLAPPGLTRVFFADAGANAVEAALKIAVQYHANRGDPDRHLVMGFTNNYHGDTLGAVGVAPDEVFHWPFLGLLPGHPRAPYPTCYRCPVGREWPDCGIACFAEVERLVEARAGELAAVIVEPVEGAGGIVPAPAGYLGALRELTRKHGILLIVDEVATGMGRTGRLFASEADGVAPDLLCLGKGLSGGYLPLSATLATEPVFAAFLGEHEERTAFFHGHSFTGNPLACAAGLASLDLLEELLPRLPGKAELLRELCAPLREHRHVGDVRQAGLMVGVELVADRESRRPFPSPVRAGHRVADRARERGLLVRPIGNVVIFMPPLASTPEELREMARILVAAFGDAAAALDDAEAGT
jgi:adenosylmethionine-8-amino-7-oxononanoate aminotransferase